jgi:predicted nucleic acid-binding protein
VIVLDASVVIAQFATYDPHATAAWRILDRDDDFAIHPMTLAEVLVRPVEQGREPLVARQIADFGVAVLEIADDEPLRLARLRARTRLRLPHCCVLDAALRHDADLATFDGRLAEAARSEGVTVFD